MRNLRVMFGMPRSPGLGYNACMRSQLSPQLSRLLVALVVALVVPLQGMASVMAAQCMAAGHHDAAAMSHADETHGHDAQGHDAHGHDAGGSEHRADPSPESKSPHCGPCAACCASANLASPALGLVFAPSASDAPYVFSQFLPPGERPGSLDRPPLAL